MGIANKDLAIIVKKLNHKPKVLEYWSNGVLGLKAEMDLILTLLPLVMRDPNMVYIFPLYINHSSIHYSNTPILQYSGCY
jgi:hypothetical protein